MGGAPKNRGPLNVCWWADMSELSFPLMSLLLFCCSLKKYFVKAVWQNCQIKHCKTVDTLHKMRRRACLNSLCLLS